MKKLLYEQPLAEIFEVHLQRSVLQGGSPEYSSKGTEFMKTDSEEDF
ncbi:MAG: hypothetical protein IKX71_04295 [Bacteroidales bacterium]|nr:hypothetical protein [Bacteroidales bacterium]